MAIVWLIGGVGLLVVGGEWLVRGSSRLAALARVSPVVIGLTVVAYGTSAPEMAISLTSVLQGKTDIAFGNIVGSNIFNVLFILGISALVVPLNVEQRIVRIDVPLMIGISLLAYGFVLDQNLNRIEGGVLFAVVLVYTVYAVVQSRRESNRVKEEYIKEYGKKPEGSWVVQLVWIGMGLLLLIVGSRWLVNGAVSLARLLGVSELIIGLTIVAAGTSLPEVATSVVAAIRGERDIAVGNIVGSNIFNLSWVLGLSGVFAREGIPVSPSALGFDVPVMIGVAVACLPIFFTGRLIARWEGGLFLAYYVAYTSYLVLDAVEHDALPLFSATMFFFVIPLTGLTLGYLVIRALRFRTGGK